MDRPDLAGPACRRGAVALEFAVVLPMMILVLVGILELGRVGAMGVRLAQAARVGAEYGALHPPDEFTQADWARQCELRTREVLLNQPGIDSNSLQVTCTYTKASPLSRSQVQVRHPFPLFVGWDSYAGNLFLQRTAVLPVIR